MKDRILAESARMFTQHGVKSIRMDDIATHLGVSKRTIYELFADKETLIYESIMSYFASIDAEHSKKKSVTNNVIEELLIMLDNIEEAVVVPQRMMEDVKRFYPAIMDRIMLAKERVGYPNLKLKLQTGIDQGLILSTIDVELAASMIADAGHGISSRSDRFVQRSFSFGNELRYMLLYFFRGLSTAKGIEIIDQYLDKNN